MTEIQVNTLIERMKTDYSFRNTILTSNSIEERLELCKQEGYNVSKSSFESLFESLVDDRLLAIDNLANTWQKGGPCHTKCAPISSN